VQVQDLLPAGFYRIRVCVRYIVAVYGAGQSADGVPDELGEGAEESGMALALPQGCPATASSSYVQSRASACKDGIGQQRHGAPVHAMRGCCKA